MADGRRRDDWWLMSHLLSLTANCHRNHKTTRALHPQDFNPMERRRRRRFTKGIPIDSGNIQILKKVFVDSQAS